MRRERENALRASRRGNDKNDSVTEKEIDGKEVAAGTGGVHCEKTDIVGDPEGQETGYEKMDRDFAAFRLLTKTSAFHGHKRRERELRAQGLDDTSKTDSIDPTSSVEQTSAVEQQGPLFLGARPKTISRRFSDVRLDVEAQYLEKWRKRLEEKQMSSESGTSNAHFISRRMQHHLASGGFESKGVIGNGVEESDIRAKIKDSD